ncbi:hypothetical protein BC008_24915 [Mastigocoleus testarum BC008]|uniref:Uncharacterized protein n=1 Tax=Mastigocoleus testarum BC008 TaxID=371196 RepID=A0A0V7ZNS3_9CYAN|nr:hypothetical protein BC008_24915 [Mastigocoleus testarum BC008]
MCVAVSVGLFDSAINYTWNASILKLREKVKNFGLPIVAQILQKDFELMFSKTVTKLMRID